MAQPGYPPNPSGQPAYGWANPSENQGAFVLSVAIAALTHQKQAGYPQI